MTVTSPKGATKAQKAQPAEITPSLEDDNKSGIQVDANDYINLLRQRNAELQHEFDMMQLAYAKLQQENAALHERVTELE